MKEHYREQKPKAKATSKHGPKQTGPKVARRKNPVAWQAFIDKRLRGLNNNAPEWIGKWRTADKAYFDSLSEKERKECEELAEEENNGVAPPEVQWENQEKHMRGAFKDFSDEMLRRYGVRMTSFATFVMRDQTVASTW